MALNILNLGQNPWVEGATKGLEALAGHKINELTRNAEDARLEKGLASLGYPKEWAKLPLPLLQQQLANVNAQMLQGQKLAQQKQSSDAYRRALLGEGNIQENNAQENSSNPSIDTRSIVGNSLGLPEELIPDVRSKNNIQQKELSPQSSEEFYPENLTEHQLTNLVKINQKKQELQSKQSKEAREFSAPYIKQASDAHKDLRDYDQLINLAQKGDLRSGNTHVILEKLGLEGFNRNLTTELADKVMNRLKQNVSTAFGKGTRITNFLEQTFQRSLPSLWNTSQGIETISKINKYVSEGLIAKDEARKQLLKQWKGIIPYNAEDLIDAAAQPKIDELERKAFNVLKTAEFPDARKIAPNKKIRSDGVIYGIRNGEWEPIG